MPISAEALHSVLDAVPCIEAPEAAEVGVAASSKEQHALVAGFLNGHLRPHQRSGLAWMHSRIAGGGGCILADSMGLGKTLQALALLYSLMNDHSTKQNSTAFKALVVCPTSLKGNWKQGLPRGCLLNC